ncbi:hypothetical protein [Streptomyces sp. NPDC006784]|uniref:baeRF2 domain-containing protein n=1 Tax=Streptomyces sp. NPDC006784 TaxID=3364764 RepID=UPI00369825BA
MGHTMELDELKSVYAHEGPFVTVYLEGRAPGEDAEKQVRLRWQNLRERLESEHADASALDAVEAALESGQFGEAQTNGRVLVAAAGDGVVLDEPWDAALGGGDTAYAGVLPELGAHVREAAQAVRVLLVVTGQEDAELRRLVVAAEHEPDEVAREEVRGGAVESPHHVREGALAHRRIQRRADEAVRQNAKEISAAVGAAVAEFHPDILVLAGEVQGRTAVREQLTGDFSGLLEETDRGGRGDSGAETALLDEVLRIAAQHSTEAEARHAGRLEEAGANRLAAKGDPEVMKAAENGAVDTLLFEQGTEAKREALLLKTGAQTGASVAVVQPGTGLPDGVGAVLRFPPEG